MLITGNQHEDQDRQKLNESAQRKRSQHIIVSISQCGNSQLTMM